MDTTSTFSSAMSKHSILILFGDVYSLLTNFLIHEAIESWLKSAKGVGVSGTTIFVLPLYGTSGMVEY
jgi:hypothetical protein